MLNMRKSNDLQAAFTLGVFFSPAHALHVILLEAPRAEWKPAAFKNTLLVSVKCYQS